MSSYILCKNVKIFCLYINLHVSYVLNIYFAEPTWTQFCFPFLMAFLKIFKESLLFICDGIVSHILGPRYSKVIVYSFHIWNNKL